MSKGVERILTLTFGTEGSETNHLGNGWSGDEPGTRWMVGKTSDLWLEHPGADHDLILEMDLGAFEMPPGHAAQRLAVGVRGRGIAHIEIFRGGAFGFHIPAALIASPGPIRLQFVHPDIHRPKDLHGGSDDRELAFAMRSLQLFRIIPWPGAARSAPTDGPPLSPAEMIVRFESLGDNCEFGLVQRRLNAEPLGLLRFSFIELPLLRRGLRCGFEGLGQQATTEVIVVGHDREYVVKESVYGMTYHTFQYEDQISLETVREQQATRLNFLRRKLMEDIAGGEKIFVIKRFPPLRPEEVLPIHTVLNETGRNWLLWMVPADAAHKPGTVQMLLPGLLRGYIDRFAPSENAHELSIDSWTSVCQAALRAVGPMLGQ